MVLSKELRVYNNSTPILIVENGKEVARGTRGELFVGLSETLLHNSYVKEIVLVTPINVESAMRGLSFSEPSPVTLGTFMLIKVKVKTNF